MAIKMLETEDIGTEKRLLSVKTVFFNPVIQSEFTNMRADFFLLLFSLVIIIPYCLDTVCDLAV